MAPEIQQSGRISKAILYNSGLGKNTGRLRDVDQYWRRVMNFVPFSKMDERVKSDRSDSDATLFI